MTSKKLDKLLDDMADSVEIGVNVSNTFSGINGKYSNEFTFYMDNIPYKIAVHHFSDNNELYIDLLFNDKSIHEDVIYINDLKVALHFKLICVIGRCLVIAKYHTM